MGLAAGDVGPDSDALAAADAAALAGGEADANADADADPLGTGVVLGVGLGDGKSELGMFANERAKISTKMTITITTQILPRLSVRGGSEPRYPADGTAGARSGAGRR